MLVFPSFATLVDNATTAKTKTQKFYLIFGNYITLDVLSTIKRITIEIVDECDDGTMIRMIFFSLTYNLVRNLVKLELSLYVFLELIFPIPFINVLRVVSQLEICRRSRWNCIMI